MLWNKHPQGVERACLSYSALSASSSNPTCLSSSRNKCVTSVFAAEGVFSFQLCLQQQANISPANEPTTHSRWQGSAFSRVRTWRRWARRNCGSWLMTTGTGSPWGCDHASWSRTWGRPGCSQRWTRMRSSPATTSRTAAWEPVRFLTWLVGLKRTLKAHCGVNDLWILFALFLQHLLCLHWLLIILPRGWGNSSNFSLRILFINKTKLYGLTVWQYILY